MYSSHITSLTIAACWLAWMSYWAFSWKKEKVVTEKQNRREALAYWILLSLGFILLFSYRLHIPVVGHVLFASSTALSVIGTVLCILGLYLTIWSRLILADNWSPDVSFKKGQILVTDGPYSITRHPIYTGLTMMFLGTALVHGTIGACIAVLSDFISFMIKLNYEEHQLLEHFGSNYKKYQQRTKQIIPFLY